MKNIKKWVVIVLMVGMLIPMHQHNEDCVYDEDVQHQCNYEIDMYELGNPNN